MEIVYLYTNPTVSVYQVYVTMEIVYRYTNPTVSVYQVYVTMEIVYLYTNPSLCLPGIRYHGDSLSLYQPNSLCLPGIRYHGDSVSLYQPNSLCLPGIHYHGDSLSLYLPFQRMHNDRSRVSQVRYDVTPVARVTQSDHGQGTARVVGEVEVLADPVDGHPFNRADAVHDQRGRLCEIQVKNRTLKTCRHRSI